MFHTCVIYNTMFSAKMQQ